MKPKQAKKEPSERTRNLRHGPLPEKVDAAAPEAETDGKTRVNAQISSLALRTAAQSGVHKSHKKRETTKQRRRREAMVEKALAFSDKIEKKAVETEKSQKNVKTRAMGWERINEGAMAELYAADERVARGLDDDDAAEEEA